MAVKNYPALSDKKPPLMMIQLILDIRDRILIKEKLKKQFQLEKKLTTIRAVKVLLLLALDHRGLPKVDF